MAILVTALVALTASGCGSDDASDKRPAPPRFSAQKERFIAQADRVCGARRGELLTLRRRVQEATEGGASPRELYRVYAVLTEQAAAVYDASNRDLAALAPPAADRALWMRMGGLLARVARLEHETADAAAHLDAPRMKSLVERVKRAVAEYRRLAGAYGFRVCGHTA